MITGPLDDRLFSCSFYPLISNLTRITSHTATLIDNIFTYQLSDVFNGIVPCTYGPTLAWGAQYGGHQKNFPDIPKQIFRTYHKISPNIM
jgi:hypothetical protein